MRNSLATNVECSRKGTVGHCITSMHKDVGWLKHRGVLSKVRLAPSLCISHPTKSDIHEIIMHPLEEGKVLLCAEIQRLVSARGFSL